MAHDSLLEIKNLMTHFHLHEGIVRAVDGVSFDVRRGQTLGMLALEIPTDSESGLCMDSLQQALRDNDIDIDEIRRLAESDEVQGTIVEIEEHAKGTRTIISIE